MAYTSLIINPGSTSTKIGVFEDEKLLFDETLRHSTEEIAKYGSIYEQKDFRKEVILNILKEKREYDDSKDRTDQHTLEYALDDHVDIDTLIDQVDRMESGIKLT